MTCFERHKYNLYKKISCGGFSNVFVATYKHNEYAVKTLKSKNFKMYKQECYILASLNHPFICRFIEDICINSKYAIVMDFIDGVELYDVIYKQNSLSYIDTRFIGACILSALIYLHDMCIIYRDIKPENIIINNDGYAILVDFGFAKKLQSKSTQTYCGTKEYMAPEIIAKKAYAYPVDMYAYGVLLYEMYTGTLPVKHNDNSINFENIPISLTFIIRNLLSYNSYERKSALAIRWSRVFFDIDFEKLEQKEYKSSYKSQVNLLFTTR